jgi:hypothetical protein
MYSNKIYSFFTLILLFLINDAAAQIVVDEAPRGLYYARTARIRKFKDMKNMRDVFHCDKYLMGRNRISGSSSFNIQRVIIDNGIRRKTEFRSAMSWFTRFRFFEEFSFNSTFFIDFNQRATARWIADYTYSIGRYNWRPRKFNFGYENYINNKYTDDIETFSEKFMEGYYFLSYNYVFPEYITQKIKLDSTTHIKLTPFFRFAARYRDENEIVHYEGKPTIGVSSRITLIRNFYLEGGLYYYFQPVFRQLPWDPDYTFGFGHYNWRSFRLSVTYGNWAINRFPGKEKTYSDYGFLDGVLKVTFNWIW